MKEHKKQTCKVRRKDVGNVQAKLINFNIRPVEILKTSLPSLNIDLPHVWMGKKIILSSKEKNNTLLWQAIIRWALERISEKGEKWDFFQEPVPGRLIQWDWSKGDFFWDPFFFSFQNLHEHDFVEKGVPNDCRRERVRGDIYGWRQGIIRG